MRREDQTIKVLDHGHVRLVSCTQPVIPNPDWTGDLEVVRNARVSYNAEWRTGEDEGKDERLIKYLARNKHTSPFEAMDFTFDVKCPLFVARQWMRHRTWSYNEVSARYTQLPAEMYVPDANVIGRQSKDNKQAREISLDLSADEWSRQQYSAYLIDEHNRASYRLYQELLERGVPRELARGVLPLNTYTHFFAKVDLHNLMHFLVLRLHDHAQYEIRVYAEALLTLIEPIVPISAEAIREAIGAN